MRQGRGVTSKKDKVGLISLSSNPSKARAKTVSLRQLEPSVRYHHRANPEFGPLGQGREVSDISYKILNPKFAKVTSDKER